MADEKISAMTSAGALTGAEEVPVVRVGDTVNYSTTTQAIANLAAGGVTSIVAGALLAGGTITSAGTISVAAIAADTILANATGSSAVPTAVPLGAGLAFSAGALTATGGAGTVTSVAAGTGLTGGTITASGTIAVGAQPGVASVSWDSTTTVANGTVPVFICPWASGTITTAKYYTNGTTPSFTFAVQINGAPITGLSAVTVTSATPGIATATAANTLVLGDVVTLVVSSASGTPQNAAVDVNFTRSVN